MKILIIGASLMAVSPELTASVEEACKRSGVPFAHCSGVQGRCDLPTAVNRVLAHIPCPVQNRLIAILLSTNDRETMQYQRAVQILGRRSGPSDEYG